MKRAIAIAAAALAGLLAAARPASAERLVTSISRHQVLVTSNFTGTAIVLFGTIEPDTPASRRRSSGYDLVVTVTRPRSRRVVDAQEGAHARHLDQHGLADLRQRAELSRGAVDPSDRAVRHMPT